MRLRQLLEEFPGQFELVHRAFILLPEDRDREFTEYYLRHRRAARELTGLPYDLPPVGARYPRSSLPALLAAEWVKRHAPERFLDFDAAVYAAFFGETRDISSPEVLADLASRAGIDGAALVRDLAQPELERAVWSDYEAALQLGVTSIPTVVLGGQGLSGAVPYTDYRDLARAALQQYSLNQSG